MIPTGKNKFLFHRLARSWKDLKVNISVCELAHLRTGLFTSTFHLFVYILINRPGMSNCFGHLNYPVIQEAEPTMPSF